MPLILLQIGSVLWSAILGIRPWMAPSGEGVFELVDYPMIMTV